MFFETSFDSLEDAILKASDRRMLELSYNTGIRLKDAGIVPNQDNSYAVSTVGPPLPGAASLEAAGASSA